VRAKSHRPSTARRRRRTSAKRAGKRHFFGAARLLPTPRTRRRWRAIFLAAPGALQAVVIVAVVLLGWMVVNGAYHVVRKPTELFFPVSGTLNKTPAETWRAYAPLFRAHSTAVMRPDFLAALAQVEAAGNPVARTYWRWSLRSHPLDIYRPASSAVGMFQITDGTFEEARRYCVHNHVVVEDGSWKNRNSCWFNSLYMRVVPSHAVEMTAAYLDRRVVSTLARHRIARASISQQQQLATLIHLCGAGAGNVYARRGLRLAPGQQCGDHDARGYLNKVQAMQRVFARISLR
jgi:Transglycosylase SLT domain